MTSHAAALLFSQHVTPWADPEFDLGEAFWKENFGGFHSCALLKLLDYYVECSSHFLFISLSDSCVISLNKTFSHTNIAIWGP